MFMSAGCMRDVMLNSDRLPMSDAQTDKFEITVTGGDEITSGCSGCPANVNVCGAGQTCDTSSGKFNTFSD